MTRLVSLFLLACCAAAVAHAAGFAHTDGLLIEYDFRSDKLINNDPTPLVRVYGDGRLEVAIPWHRQDRGFYEGRLAPKELAEILGTIEATGTLSLAPEDIALAKRLVPSEPGPQQHFYRSENEFTRMAFALEGAKTMRESQWRNLRVDQQRYGSKVREVELLWSVDRRLHGLSRHPSLERVRGDAVPGAMLPPEGGQQ